jgi:hypothetical protein
VAGGGSSLCIGMLGISLEVTIFYGIGSVTIGKAENLVTVKTTSHIHSLTLPFKPHQQYPPESAVRK